MENSDSSNENPILESAVKLKRCAPTELLACAKLPRAYKMAIFEERRRKILEFLVDEHYSGIKNLANVINSSRQTAERILKNLCDENYVVKSDVGLGFTKKMLVYQITHTGAMYITDGCMPSLQDVSKLSDEVILRDFQLQEARISLYKSGYTEFKNAKQLQQIKHQICNLGYKLPQYLCLDCEGRSVAVEYEDIIKSGETYQQIIDQYAKAKQDKVIDKVLFFTRPGFADKLQKLIFSLNAATINNSDASYISNYFYFL